MNFTLEQQEGVRIVRLLGSNLDGRAVERLHELVTSLETGTGPLLLDLELVEFIDSAGLGLLRTISLAAPGMAMCCVGRRAARCLNRIPVDRQPVIHLDQATGLSALAGRRMVAAESNTSAEMESEPLYR